MEEINLEQTPFEELLRGNREYQSAFDKKVDKALQTARANWERERDTALEQQRQSALDEARAAAAAEFDRRQGELAQREAEFDRKLREMAVAQHLMELGLPAKFAPWLTGQDAEDSLGRVADFEAAFRGAVTESVTARLGSPLPMEPVPAPELDRDAIRAMSPKEINARWAEIQTTLKGEH